MENEKEIKKWTLKEVETHVKVNAGYWSAPVLAALYKKLYGEFPKIGMSGFQGVAAESVFDCLPRSDESCRTSRKER